MTQAAGQVEEIDYLSLADVPPEAFEELGRRISNELLPRAGEDYRVYLGAEPPLREGERLISYTLSTCPECRSLLRAVVFERGGKVWIRKVCPEHGEFEEVYWGSYRLYERFRRWQYDGRGLDNPQLPVRALCPYNCGLCPRHKSHPALVNIVATNRCDLSCWYCLPGDQEVLVRDRGTVRLASLEELARGLEFKHKVRAGGFEGEYAVPDSLEVLGYVRGRATWVRVSKFFRRRHRGKVYTIRTRTGREVRVTPEHRILVRVGDGFSLKEAGDVKVGDRVLVVARVPPAEDCPGEVNVLEALTQAPDDERGRVYVSGVAWGDDLVRALRRGFGDRVYLWKHRDSIPLLALCSSGGSTCCAASKLGLDATSMVFKYVFEISERAPNKRLPKQALSLPLLLKLALLSGLFNGDGYVARGRKHVSLGYATVSRGLARDLIYLLASLGVFARVYTVSKTKSRLARHDLHKLSIAGREMERLVSLLDLKPSHRARLEGVSPRREIRVERHGDFVVDEVVSVEVEDYDGFVYDLEVDSDDHLFVANDGVVVSNCFFYAAKTGYVYEPTLNHIRFMLRKGRELRPYPAIAVQITGGEPLLRDDIVEMVRIAKEEGYKHVQLNTTGIRLAYDRELAIELRRAGTNVVYMSFDGVTPYTNPKNHWEVPYTLENLRAARLPVVLVPTVIRGYNLSEVGKIIKFGLKHLDVVRGVNFQPVSLVGRVPRDERERLRVTIPDVLYEIERQTDGQVRAEDWYPVPTAAPVSHFVEALTGRPQFTLTAHFACGAATYVFKDGDEIVPISRFVDVDGLMNFLEGKAAELRGGKSKYLVMVEVLAGLRRFVDMSEAPRSLRRGRKLLRLLFRILVRHDYGSLGAFHYSALFLGMMHFQDLYNYDVSRVQRCEVHYLMPDGRIVPFCTFNVMPELYRDRVQRAYGVPLKRWLDAHGLRLESFKYRRNIRRLISSDTYVKAYEGIADVASIPYEEHVRASLEFGIPVEE